MIQKLSVPITVVSLFDHRKRLAMPKKLFFDGHRKRQKQLKQELKGKLANG